MRYVSDQCYETIPIAFCIYCGECWDVYDHVPPVSAWCTNSSWAFKYPACNECNSILGSVPIKDIRVRRYIILKKLYSKYKKLIKLPEWERLEIEDLRGFIKNYVEKSCVKQKFILKKIDFLCENYKALK
jgi:hypothetical protein